jgi:hypothetical protein
MENPETQATLYTRHRRKTKKTKKIHHIRKLKICATQATVTNKSYSNKATLLLDWNNGYTKLYSRHHELVDRYKIWIDQLAMDLFM